MGNFINNKHILDYRDLICIHCVHFHNSCYLKCPVILVHKNFKTTEDILNMLIPVDAKGANLKCKMFYPYH